MKTILLNFNYLLKVLLINVFVYCSSLSFAEEVSTEYMKPSISVEVTGMGQPILFIPGLMSDSSVWRETAAKLGTSYQFHFVTIAGFAGQKPIHDLSIEQLYSDLNHYLITANLNNVIVIGHSMGGFLAYKLALSGSKNVAKVIAVDGLPFITPIFTRTNKTQVNEAKAYAQSVKAQYYSADKSQLAGLIRQGLNIQAKSKQAQTRVFEMAKMSDPVSVGNVIYDLMTTDLRHDLKQSNTPILLLGASGAFRTEAEHNFIEALYKEQFDSVKQAQVIMNRQARHFIMLDDLPWLIKQVNQFISVGK